MNADTERRRMRAAHDALRQHLHGDDLQAKRNSPFHVRSFKQGERAYVQSDAVHAEDNFQVCKMARSPFLGTALDGLKCWSEVDIISQSTSWEAVLAEYGGEPLLKLFRTTLSRKA